MWRKLIIVAIIFTLLSFGFYKFGYQPLETRQSQALLEYSQTMNQFEEKKEQVLNFEKTKLKYEQLLKKLERKNKKDFLQKKERNRFIIYLNSFDVIQDIEFNSRPETDLQVDFVIAGEFATIYDFLTEIDYIYNTKQLQINKVESEIKAKLSLVFPIERSD
ncbi:MAG: hypothetical protein ACQEP9_08440 [Bacillota bacterium]